MLRYWILAVIGLSLGACDGPSEIFGNSIQPDYESAFYEGDTPVRPYVKHEITPGIAANDFTPRASQEEMFYNLSDDPENLRLLALDTIAGSGAQTSVVVVNLFKNSERFGLMTTWHIDCEKSQMAVMRITKFQEDKESLDSPIEMKMISTRDSPHSRRMEELVCEGKGQLEKEKAYRGKLIDIIASFWEGNLTPVSEEPLSPSQDEYVFSGPAIGNRRSLPPASSTPTSRTLS